MSRRATIAATLALAVSAIGASGQSVEDLLGRYTGSNANGFLQPLADVLGASLNSGWARSARIESGFHLRISFIAAGTPLGDASRTFLATPEDDFPTQTTVEASTIFGPIETVAVQGPDGTAYRFPGGINATRMGTIVPQLTLGTVAGTEAMVRWSVFDLDDDFGEISLLGAGIRHDLIQYLPTAPVDLAVGAYWQSFKVGDVVETSAFLGMVHASRSTGVLTLFGALGFERSTTDIRYVQEGETGGIEVALDGANSVRATLGLSLGFGVGEVFADYSLASQNVFTLGLGFGR